ncbi:MULTISPECIES: hypothetical protein [unclassified Mesorhizobium]|uniref:hypothetical protein n=1 Tax=unclassified Mesorhizobium TaxID=325217 RepID=UPI00112D3A7F|nr:MULTISPECIES: hypothetical protein [unclassified Mesorhizobium]TPL42614.1 hypothetical protein FJ961_07960 [Mesorhizobium sp. B2-4-5]TPL66617.1 hypothetical protein FJ949_09640 [Mesorhizobium sp. B2-4-1]
MTSDMGKLPSIVAANLARTIERSNRTNFFATKAETLAKRISDGIDAELRKIGQFISSELIGIHSETEYGGKTSLEIDEFDEAGIMVDWRNLANITRRKKTANKDKFFLHTSALRSEIRAKAGPGLVNLNSGFKSRGGSGVVSYGCVTIRPSYYTDDTGKRVYKIADISINLLAGAPASAARAVLTQQVFNQSHSAAGNMPVLARLMGLSESAIKKLEGGVIDRNRIKRRNRSGFKIGSVENTFTGDRMNFYRPMLEPSLAYFFQKRVPAAVEKALNRYSIGKIRQYGGNS